jgi:hypothetical protein
LLELDFAELLLLLALLELDLAELELDFTELLLFALLELDETELEDLTLLEEDFGGFTEELLATLPELSVLSGSKWAVSVVSPTTVYLRLA